MKVMKEKKKKKDKKKNKKDKKKKKKNKKNKKEKEKERQKLDNDNSVYNGNYLTPDSYNPGRFDDFMKNESKWLQLMLFNPFSENSKILRKRGR